MIRLPRIWPFLAVRPENRRKRIFAQIHKSNFWQGEEAVSGPGSGLASTAMLRSALPGLLAELRVLRLLDIPCGDFYWMRTIDLGGIEYIGGDLVPALVRENRRRYGNASRTFEVLDLCEGPLPQADLLLVRDCLVHLDYGEIGRALASIRKSGTHWLLMTHFTHDVANEDIPTGRWRPLNFTLPPFSFPPPRLTLADGWPEGESVYAYKTMALWEVAELPEFML
ncbi:MAG: class I SAM-dependent methyltransferase [Acidithiobacillus sp.]